MAERFWKRLGAGFAALGSLIWLLWGGVKGIEPEPLFVFFGALVGWIYLELERKEYSSNDINLAADILRLSATTFRDVLKDHDFHNPISYDVVTRVHEFEDRVVRGAAYFSDKKLQDGLESFVRDLNSFTSVLIQEGHAEGVPPHAIIRTKPLRQYLPDEDYKAWQARMRNLNALATKAWGSLEALSQNLRQVS